MANYRPAKPLVVGGLGSGKRVRIGAVPLPDPL